MKMKMTMKIDPDPNHNGEVNLRSKIAELESQLELSTLDSDKSRRECLILKGAVARLEEDRSTLREREVRDQETINVLMEDIESKNREIIELKVVNRDLECGKKKAQDEAHKCKNHCCELEAQLSKLANETALQFERKENELKEKFVALAAQNMELEKAAARLYEENCRLKGKENVKVKEQSVDTISGKPAHDIYDKMPKRTAEYSAPRKSSEKDFTISSSEPKRKRASVVIDIDSDGEHGSCDSVDEEDKITLSQLLNKKIEEVAEGGKKELGSSTVQQRSKFGSNAVKLTSSEVAAKNNGSRRLKKKVKRSDFSCPLTARNPGSTDCSGVAGEIGRAYCKRNCKNQTSEREYTERIPSAEQIQHAKRKAEKYRRTLKSCNPSFSKSIVRSHVCGSFWFSLPTKFCVENLLSREMQMILEDERGLEYEVKCLGKKGDLSSALSSGWRRFALAHKLEFGDALIFELIAPTRFKVYIIKAIPGESIIHRF